MSYTSPAEEKIRYARDEIGIKVDAAIKSVKDYLRVALDESEDDSNVNFVRRSEKATELFELLGKVKERL